MRKISENDEGLIFLIVGLIILIVVALIAVTFFMDMIIYAAVIIGLIIAMSTIAKYVPMPQKIYGIVACVAILIVLLFIMTGGFF